MVLALRKWPYAQHKGLTKEHEHKDSDRIRDRRRANARWRLDASAAGRYAMASEEPEKTLENLAERTIFRLDLKTDDAEAKGLQLPLATVRQSVDRFFAELSKRLRQDDL